MAKAPKGQKKRPQKNAKGEFLQYTAQEETKQMAKTQIPSAYGECHI